MSRVSVLAKLDAAALGLGASCGAMRLAVVVELTSAKSEFYTCDVPVTGVLGPCHMHVVCKIGCKEVRDCLEPLAVGSCGNARRASLVPVPGLGTADIVVNHHDAPSPAVFLAPALSQVAARSKPCVLPRQRLQPIRETLGA
eukprot:891500-Pyramimonas_sp.AAC.1